MANKKRISDVSSIACTKVGKKFKCKIWRGKRKKPVMIDAQFVHLQDIYWVQQYPDRFSADVAPTKRASCELELGYWEEPEIGEPKIKILTCRTKP